MVEVSPPDGSAMGVGIDDEEDEGPVFDRSDKVVRLHREEKEHSLAGFYFFVVPAVLLTWFVIGWLINDPSLEGLLWVAFPIALWGGACYLYIVGGARPACSIDLTRDSISQFEGEELDTEIRFGSTVDVDIILNEHTKDPRFGHLWGYRFSKGGDVIEFTAGDGWELWDVQGISRPVFEVVDVHGMRQGTALRDYREALAGGVPRRHRRA